VSRRKTDFSDGEFAYVVGEKAMFQQSLRRNIRFCFESV
jgi:hypothetical protein